jgi:regulator of protease activity HflC (stomatin/prohibitin superfamily)
MNPMYITGIFILAVVLMNIVKILKEYERGVIFRFGRLRKARGPGLILLIPFVEKMIKVDLRVITMDVPPQDIITRDNVSVKVNAVLYFKVIDPSSAIVEVDNYLYATSQRAQTTLRSICGESELDDLLVKREELNERIQTILDAATDPWGIKVTNVEIKHIDLPLEMQRAMAKQAEAERERRAKVISAEAEFQAAEKLSQAAKIIASEPQALQLRYLQTLREVAAENNSTTLFPIPVDFLNAFMKR